MQELELIKWSPLSESVAVVIRQRQKLYSKYMGTMCWDACP